MSVYMTEEEQLAAIKAWWSRNQRWITVVLSAALVVVATYRYITWQTEKTTHRASDAYEQLMRVTAADDSASIEAHAKALIKNHPKTVYRDAAALLLAKHWVSVNQSDEARETLQSVVKHAKMPALKQVAQIRLVRLWISEKSYDNALNTLEKMDDAMYKPLIEELKGDIYAAQGRTEAAALAYREAREEIKLRGISNMFLEMKSNEFALNTSR